MSSGNKMFQTANNYNLNPYDKSYNTPKIFRFDNFKMRNLDLEILPHFTQILNFNFWF